MVKVNHSKLTSSSGVSRSVVSDCLRPHGLYPPGSSVHGILQARILDRLPFPSPGDLPNPGMERGSPAFQADSLPSELQGSPGLTFIQRLIKEFS